VGLLAALRITPARVDAPTRERVAKLASFRRFLRWFSDLPNAPALAIVVRERYLEFATALGVAREVERHVKALVPVESLPRPFPGRHPAVQAFALEHGGLSSERRDAFEHHEPVVVELERVRVVQLLERVRRRVLGRRRWRGWRDRRRFRLGLGSVTPRPVDAPSAVPAARRRARG
jgi:hypothetical protein